MKVKPIGTVKSRVREGNEVNWRESVSEIHLDESLIDGLKGLDEFSHVVIVFHLNKASFNPETDLIRRPRGRSDMPMVGVFARRSPYRPNPLGITTVELLEINRNILRVKGLDAFDGTPVLDIKPYVTGFDKMEGVVVPEWMERLLKGIL